MIPESAVEAAMRHFPPLYRSVVVAALEAAAPHMLEQAYTDGYCDGMSGDQHKVDQYRPTP